jgi:hypothetical protein
MTLFERARPSRRLALLVALAAVCTLAIPSIANAERPDIERVTVRRDENGLLMFRIFFASPVGLDPADQLQVAIDADRDPSTGVDGLDYSLDQSGSLIGVDDDRLLTAVDGEPVESNPPELRFDYEPAAFGFTASSATFSVPASLIGDPARFDFYVFIRVDGDLDEAPSHVLFSAGSLPWTYPQDGEPSAGEAYPVETYVDGSDATLHERPRFFLVVVAALVFGVGGLLAVGGWSVQRIRERKRSQTAAPPADG